MVFFRTVVSISFDTVLMVLTRLLLFYTRLWLVLTRFGVGLIRAWLVLADVIFFHAI